MDPAEHLAELAVAVAGVGRVTNVADTIVAPLVGRPIESPESSGRSARDSVARALSGA
jgi:hypothetical protein